MMPRNPIKSLLLACLLATTATAAADTAKPLEAPVPLLWKVSDADNAVYLLGSFHLLRPSDYPLSGDVDAAFADAEALMFELAPEEVQSGELGMQMIQAGIRSDGRTLQDDLDPDTWARLQAWTAKSGVSLDSFASLEPWFAGMSVAILEMTRQGLDPKLGLDSHFMERASESGKPTAGLERGQEQIALLDRMDATEQRQFLAEALEQAEKGSVETARLHQAWRRGDAEGLWTGMAADMKREYPRLYQRINVDRNDAWVPKIERRLTESTSDDTLVVVGALHLLGADGVVEKLRARGYTVERVCSACKPE